MKRFMQNYSFTSLKNVVKIPIHRGEQPQYSETGIDVIKTVNLKDGFIDYDNCLKVSKEFFDANTKAQVRRGDILISSTGFVSLGKVDIYDRDTPAVVDGHISILRLRDDYNPYFITYFLRSVFGKLQFEKWCTGSSGQIELQPYDLERFVVPDNSPKGIAFEKQKEIVEKMKVILNNIEDLEKQFNKASVKIYNVFNNEIFRS